MSPLRHILLVLGGVVIISGIIGLIFSLINKKTVPVIEPLPEIITPEKAVMGTSSKVIGYSVENRKIESFSFGTGARHLLFVGGIHGGYEWNSILLAYQFIDYLNQNLETIPTSVTIDVIPSINPDALYAVIKKEGRFKITDIPLTTTVGLGRFNAHQVDLNRNFACKWQPQSSWRSQTVSAGTSAFSEPETKALRDFVNITKPEAVIFWHSQANAVYASECTNGVLPDTITLMETYAQAANYKSVATFDAYPVTGDAEGWLASIGIPAITVELANHESTEWDKNLAGIKAVLRTYIGK